MRSFVCAAAIILGMAACGGNNSKAAAEPTTTEKVAADEPAPRAAEGAAPEPANEVTPLTAADFPELIGLFDAMTRAVVDNAGNCGGMADALEGVVAARKLLVARVRISREDDALYQQFEATYGGHLDQGKLKMGPILAACQSNARVMRVFTEAL